MRIHKSFHVEKCLLSPKEERPYFVNAWLDVVKKVVHASDGNLVVTVPVDVHGGDTSGWVTGEAFSAARKGRDKDSADPDLASIDLTDDHIVIKGAMFPRPQHDVIRSPTHEAAQNPDRCGDEGTTTICVNARLLLNLAQALGSVEAGVILTFSTLAAETSISVMPNREDHPDLSGTLMPMRMFRKNTVKP